MSDRYADDDDLYTGMHCIPASVVHPDVIDPFSGAREIAFTLGEMTDYLSQIGGLGSVKSVAQFNSAASPLRSYLVKRSRLKKAWREYETNK